MLLQLLYNKYCVISRQLDLKFTTIVILAIMPIKFINWNYDLY